MARDDEPVLREVLFEMRPVGRMVRVAAIDPDTRTEITMIGDINYGEEALKRLAIRKLRYVLRKQQRERRRR